MAEKWFSRPSCSISTSLADIKSPKRGKNRGAQLSRASREHLLLPEPSDFSPGYSLFLLPSPPCYYFSTIFPPRPVALLSTFATCRPRRGILYDAGKVIRRTRSTVKFYEPWWALVTLEFPLPLQSFFPFFSLAKITCARASAFSRSRQNPWEFTRPAERQTK